MAKATWCSVSPASGTGNGTVNVSGSAHTGRTQRSTSLTFKADGVTDKTVAVSQAAKAEFVTINNASATKAGGEITISGTSNSSKLTFSLGSGDITITLPTNYTANSVSTANGAAITGDPGATAQYSFSLKVTVPANNTITAKTRVITATTNGNQTANSTITQEKGDPTLSVTPTTIALDTAGAAKSVSVTSNAAWTVS